MINGYLVVIPENQDTELRQFIEKNFGRRHSLNVYYLKSSLKDRFGCNLIEILSDDFVDRFGKENVARAYKSRIYKIKGDLIYKL